MCVWVWRHAASPWSRRREIALNRKTPIFDAPFVTKSIDITSRMHPPPPVPRAILVATADGRRPPSHSLRLLRYCMYVSIFFVLSPPSTLSFTMHLMYYLDGSGKRVYTLKVRYNTRATTASATPNTWMYFRLSLTLPHSQLTTAFFTERDTGWQGNGKRSSRAVLTRR